MGSDYHLVLAKVRIRLILLRFCAVANSLGSRGMRKFVCHHFIKSLSQNGSPNYICA